MEIDVVGKFDVSGVDSKDFESAFDVRQTYHHFAVESAGTEQGGVERVGAIRGGDRTTDSG